MSLVYFWEPVSTNADYTCSGLRTSGFPFRPWHSNTSIADAGDIATYIEDTAKEFGIDKKIKYNHKVTQASWSSKEKKWTLKMELSDEKKNVVAEKIVLANFIFACSGYYSYDEGYYPDLPGATNFQGDVLKPQFWPENYDYTGKEVVVIGSGATAVTLLPNMIKGGAKHATMLQRSPGYYMLLARVDPVARVLSWFLPQAFVSWYMRIRNSIRFTLFFVLCKMFPNAARRVIRFLTARQLPSRIPLDPHFQPNYKPWDQRVCIVPDGDFFQSLRDGTGDIATGHIDTFTKTGIRLKDGTFLNADVVVQATGLKVQLFGGCDLIVDGRKVETGKKTIYRGQMLDGVPNLALSFGYTNASWTLGSDLCSQYVCQLLNHMTLNGKKAATPRLPQSKDKEAPAINLSAGYIQRAQGVFPKSTGAWPWKMKDNYLKDYIRTSFGDQITDIEFS